MMLMQMIPVEELLPLLTARASKLTSTLQQTAGKQSTYSDVLSMRKLFVKVNKFMGTIKQ